jgi:glyoxylase-like metal-dependent hydrolase (beta-lactamase superfamily II)/rhodanese-related sulfurtransferase
VGGYLEEARQAGLTIEKVIETHFHADFLSGHLELAARTGAEICYGDGANADFPITLLADGQQIDLGEVMVEVRATPGHTPESISLVLYEHAADTIPYGVLTGDTLFIGDVGRPDLLSSDGATADELARLLYRSLHRRLLTLPDETLVFPAHGSGSACGKSLSTETFSTLGEQRRTNYALAPMSEDEFVAVVTEGQPVAPAYFPFSANRNRERHALLAEHEPPRLLDVEAVRAAQAEGAVVLDTRDATDFAAGHLRRSLNVGLGGRFSEYAGDVIAPGQPIVLVCDPDHELEARVRLARIGFDQVTGALADPMRVFQEHQELVDRSSRVTAGELESRRRELSRLVVLDVRNPGERAVGAIPGSVGIPLAALTQRLSELDLRMPTVVYCAGGYRSSIAASVLAAAGFADVSDLLGGYAGWSALASSPAG